MSGDLRFGLLGPISVHVDDVDRTPSRGRLRDLLGLLLAHAGTPVPSTTLIRSLYGQDPPATAVTALQVHVSQLRKVLAPQVGARAPEQRLRTCPGAYLLRVEPGELDLARFDALAEQGAAQLRDGRPAAATLRAALAQWSGERAAEGARAPALTDEFAAWADGRRLAVLELCLEAEAAEAADAPDTAGGADGPGGLLAELRGLVATHELHEGFARLLALALYRAGRQADALAALSDVRRRLAGAGCGSPGEPLRLLQQRILAADPSLMPSPRDPSPCATTPSTAEPAAEPTARTSDRAAGPPADVPAQLPARHGHLHGRDDAVADLVSALRAPGGGAAVVTGAAGVGTTSVAVAVAHAVRDRFPGGQLFVRVEAGADPRPVLRGFLTALGAPAPGPAAGPARLVGRLRVALRGRDVLVVLDDVTPAHRVLLDGLAATPGVGVLATAAHPVGTVPAVPLGPLDTRAATALLAAGAGADRLAAEPAATAAVLDACGHLPLALRTAAALLAARPHWPVRVLARRLAVPGTALDELVAGDLTVRGSLLRRYRGCPRLSRRAFRMLGALGPDPVQLTTVGDLLDAGTRAGAAAVTGLVDAGLVVRAADGALSLTRPAAALAAALLDDATRVDRDHARVVAARERRRSAGRGAGRAAVPA